VADFNQFGSAKPNQPSDPKHCAQCEAMLADAIDGTLSTADQATFDLHLVGCPTCAEMFAGAQRGAAWMEMLHSPRPEPPANLLERIIAQTSGQAAKEAAAAIVLGPTDYLRQPVVRPPNTLLGRPTLVPSSISSGHAAAFPPANVLPFRSRVAYGLRSLGQTMLQPRLAMTAAMAFFSIALTMNLTGVHLSGLRASDLKPSSIMRSCYETKARVVRYSDNLRVVYELESRVRDLQRSSDSDDNSTSTPASQNNSSPAQQPDGSQKPDGQNQKPDQKQTRPRNPGSSRRESPSGSVQFAEAAAAPIPHLSPQQALAVFGTTIFKPEGGLV
jgi:Putative zinc-finger